MNAPKCCYCDEPLTDNDRDAETGGYWSAHFFRPGGGSCVWPVADGRYQVAHQRFSARKRAEAQSADLERWNPGHKFPVIDLDQSKGGH
jgi:hypothetical protein